MTEPKAKKPRSPKQLQGDKIAELLHEKFPYCTSNLFSVAGQILKKYEFDSARMVIESMSVSSHLNPIALVMARLRDEIKYPRQEIEQKQFLVGFANSHRLE